MSRNELPEHGHWDRVHAAVQEQLRRADMSVARFSRESGVSETTIRYIGRPEKRQRSTLVAMSAALGWPHDYLTDLLAGTADPGPSPPAPPGHADVRRHVRAEIVPVNEKLDRLTEIVYALAGKTDMLLARSRNSPAHTHTDGRDNR